MRPTLPILAESYADVRPRDGDLHVRRDLRHRLASVGIAVGALAAAGSANATTHEPGAIVYNGHAGLGAFVYQHNQTDLEVLAAPDRRANMVLMADMGGQFR